MLRQALRRSNVRPQSLKYRRPYSIFRVSEEVAEAIRTQRPVVALESTIYTHGFPNPENAALAFSLETVVRINGGVPATIAILNGEARVGLSPDELLELAATAGKKETMKVSRRDLGFITGLGIAGRKINGGTTISGTMLLAALAGIDVFGTGGLGGVHRGGEDTMDISADLTELGRTPVCVVSSGCKSFLDIPRTLEYLETQGALVATFADGRRGDIDFPAFWTRDSGIRSPAVIQNEVEAASIIYAQRKLGIKSGILFANPIPIEHSIPKSEMDIVIDAAIQEAKEKGFFGHTNTPFILAKIKELTEGKSIPANKALVESNVAFATRVAVELSRMNKTNPLPKTKTIENASMQVPFESESSLSLSKRQRKKQRERSAIGQSALPSPPSIEDIPVAPKEKGSFPPVAPDVVVYGSVAMDLACNYTPLNPSEIDPHKHTSNPALLESTIGGVGNNVADAITKIVGPDGPKVQLRSLVGNDSSGREILRTMKYHDRLTSGIKVLSGVRTAQYVAINSSKKELVYAMADMKIFNVKKDLWDEYAEDLSVFSPPKFVVVDANWPATIIEKCVKDGKAQGATVIFEPVSVYKSRRLFSPNKEDSMSHLGVYPNHHVDISSPNEHELAAMYTAAKSAGLMESQEWFEIIDALGIPLSGARDRFVALTNKELVDTGIPQQTIQLLPFIPTILTKLGPAGVLVTELLGPDDQRLSSTADAPYILSRCTNGATNVGGVYMRHYPAIPVESEDIVSVNGAGDTFLGAVVGGLAKGAKLDDRLITLAQEAAVLTLKSNLAVSFDVKTLQKTLEELL